MAKKGQNGKRNKYVQMMFKCVCGQENVVYEHPHDGSYEFIMEDQMIVQMECSECNKTSSFWLQVVEKDEKVKLGGKRVRSRRNTKSAN